MSEEERIMQEAKRAVYLQPAMIEFLLVENLALKTLLHQKGLFTPEEFAECTKHAAAVLQGSVKKKIKEQVELLEEPFKSVLQKAALKSSPGGGASSATSPDPPPSAQ